MQISLNEFQHKLANKKALFVTNKNSFLKNKFNELLKTSNHTIFNQFELNPKLADLMHACHQFQDSSFDYIVGVGGGSAMDFAKLLHYFLDLRLHFENEYMHHIHHPSEHNIHTQLILIPTTSGSGSEATHFSVVYQDKHKFSFAHESLRAKYIVLDSIFTQNLPAKITAYTGMDAICHAIESYWAKGATEDSKEMALNALRLLVPHIKEAVYHPTNLNRMAMLEGAYLAGKAIDISKTTAAHAFSYYLTTHHFIPHGQAVALMLPYFLKVNGNYPELNKIFDTDNLAETFVKLLDDLKLNEDISYFIKDLDDFIDSVNLERLGNNPIQFSEDEFKELFSKKI